MPGIVYSIATGRIRWILYPTQGVIEYAQIKLRQGEALYQSLTEDADPNQLQVELNEKTGLIPAHDLYAIVDAQNIVTGAILADPACGDFLPEKTLIQDDAALQHIGWTYNPGVGFTAP